MDRSDGSGSRDDGGDPERGGLQPMGVAVVNPWEYRRFSIADCQTRVGFHGYFATMTKRILL